MNDRFPIKLKISPSEKQGYWVLNDYFQYITQNGLIISAPTGFETNFATVPKIFRNIIEPWGKHGPAAIIHDYTYAQGKLSRKTCDRIFLEGMKYLNVNFFKRQIMYRLVRIFGGSHYGGK